MTIQRVIRTCFILVVTNLAASSQPAPAPVKTGPGYSIKQIDGVWWLVDPLGKPFFSRGVCCVNPGIEFKDYTLKNPGYAAWHHFAEPMQWAEASMDSLRSWGFTTIGGWSSVDIFLRSPKMTMPFTVVLHMGAQAGAPWCDMWDESVINRMEELAKNAILPVKDSPFLIGYYTDNEIGWWNATLMKMTWEHKPTSGARSRLLQLIRFEYRDDWQSLSRDFEADGAMSFADLEKGGRLYLRPGSRGVVFVNKFIRLIAERYYDLCRQIIRKYNPHSLILGDRYQAFYYSEVARAAAPYVDAISTNFNANWNDGTAVRYYLPTLHQLTQKPIMVGEYYLAAMENRSGNQNNSSQFPLVQTQAERVHGFETTARYLCQTPSVIGADWFQFYDEPMFGRDDGENFNMGLIDIYGKPYEGLTQASRTLGWDSLKANSKVSQPSIATGIPPAPVKPLEKFVHGELLKNWDREHGFVPPSAPLAMADMYLAWQPDTLLIGICTEDLQEANYYKTGEIPEEDRVLLEVAIAKAAPIQVRLGGGKEATTNNKDVKVYNLSSKRNVRNIAVLKLPSTLFGEKRFAKGIRISFSATLTSFARAHTTEWKADALLAVYDSENN